MNMISLLNEFNGLNIPNSNPTHLINLLYGLIRL